MSILKFPVDMYRIIYNFMHGYDAGIHTPLKMAQNEDIVGIKWIIKNKRWSAQQINECLFYAFDNNRSNVAIFLLREVKELSKKNLFVNENVSAAR